MPRREATQQSFPAICSRLSNIAVVMGRAGAAVRGQTRYPEPIRKVTSKGPTSVPSYIVWTKTLTTQIMTYAWDGMAIWRRRSISQAVFGDPLSSHDPVCPHYLPSHKAISKGPQIRKVPTVE